jgi:hypothetical protein
MHATRCSVAGRWRNPARSALGERQYRSSKNDQSNQKESTHMRTFPSIASSN